MDREGPVRTLQQEALVYTGVIWDGAYIHTYTVVVVGSVIPHERANVNMIRLTDSTTNAAMHEGDYA